MSSIEPKFARKELLRYLRLGKSIRLRSGTNLVRNFILATQADPAIHRHCRTYQLNVSDLCIACTEILEEMPDLPGPDGSEIPASLLLFSDPPQLEGFLKNLHQATLGQTAIQRRLAIVACAKSHASQMSSPVFGQRLPPTRSNLLNKAIFNNLLLMMLVAGIIIAGILILIFLL